MKNKIIKGITLTGFIGMLGVFVAYRSGAFANADKEVSLLNNGDYLTLKVDSPPKRDPMRMSSSKAGPVFERQSTTSTVQTLTVSPNNTTVASPDMVMPSSKSGGVFNEKDIQSTTITVPPASTKKTNEAPKRIEPAKNNNSSQNNANQSNQRMNSDKKKEPAEINAHHN